MYRQISEKQKTKNSTRNFKHQFSNDGCNIDKVRFLCKVFSLDSSACVLSWNAKYSTKMPFGKRSVLFSCVLLFSYWSVVSPAFDLLTAARSRLSSCACGPAAPPWWPSRTLPARRPWSWRSTPGNRKHWSCRPCPCLHPTSPAPAGRDHTHC